VSIRGCGRTTFVVRRDKIRYEPVPDKLYGGQDRRRRLVLELDVLLLELVVVLVLWLMAMGGCY